MSVTRTLEDVIKQTLEEYLQSEEYKLSMEKFVAGVGTMGQNDSECVSYYKHVVTDYKDAKQLVHNCNKATVKQIAQNCNSMTDIVATLLANAREEIPACSICSELLTGRVGSLRCGHRFHYTCISNWLKRANTCPYCRTIAKLFVIT